MSPGGAAPVIIFAFNIDMIISSGSFNSQCTVKDKVAVFPGDFQGIVSSCAGAAIEQE
jgi:hypothetical protein